jgi:AdoMet-dependent heme synthase
MGDRPGASSTIVPQLNLVAWEITRSCNLSCAHCRASAENGRNPYELSTTECYKAIDSIKEAGNPIIILTGGEPLLRPDVFDIGKYAASKGLRVVMGSNGTIITDGLARRLAEIPISRIAVSLDFPDAELQDKFRGQAGSFAASMEGIGAISRAGLQLQINSTVTKLNVRYLDDLLNMALKLHASAFHPFFLVPTGRGKGLESEELDANEYERALNWIYDKQLELGDRIFFKPTDAPHYLRVLKQRQRADVNGAPAHNPAHAITRGCLAGTGFCFISHTGVVQGCGYLDVGAGNLRSNSFQEIWNAAPVFKALRDISGIKGKCGVCEYKKICGGCRARAYEATGDYMESEPYCLYQPSVCGRVH